MFDKMFLGFKMRMFFSFCKSCIIIIIIFEDLKHLLCLSAKILTNTFTNTKQVKVDICCKISF